MIYSKVMWLEPVLFENSWCRTEEHDIAEVQQAPDDQCELVRINIAVDCNDVSKD